MGTWTPQLCWSEFVPVHSQIDRATVYRAISLMKRLRLIDELDLMHLSGEKHFYEPKPRRDHVHLTCFECGSIEEFSSPLFDHLKLLITRKTGFQAGVVGMEVGGRCRKCCAQTCGPEDCTEVLCCKNGDSSDA
jgi:Fur family ferric uptake transcriptional regulator